VTSEISSSAKLAACTGAMVCGSGAGPNVPAAAAKDNPAERKTDKAFLERFLLLEACCDMEWLLIHHVAFNVKPPSSCQSTSLRRAEAPPAQVNR